MAARIPALCRFHTFDSRGGAKMLTRKTAMVFVAALAACMLLLGFQGAMAKTYSPKQMQGMCEKAGKATWARLGAVAAFSRSSNGGMIVTGSAQAAVRTRSACWGPILGRYLAPGALWIGSRCPGKGRLGGRGVGKA